MGIDNKPTTTVDPNTSESKNLENHSQEDFGAKTPIDHPLTQSTVDPNYSAGSAPGFPAEGSRRKRPSSEAAEDTTAVMGVNDSDY